MRIKRVPIGLRTIKTAAAIIIAMVVVDLYGATASRLIFAMLGAMAAVQPTFRESVEACLSDILGVIFGALAGVLLSMLPISHLAATGIGVILIITLYNMLRVTISPSLPCFILVMLCTTPDIAPVEYALGRIWDTAIGLGVGMAVNMLVFPYDNSRQIRSTIESLDRDLILFLEELFDGDEALPDAGDVSKKLQALERQLAVFENQKLLLHLRRQKRELERLHLCERRAAELVAQLQVLARMGLPGRLNDENRRRLAACGAEIRDTRPLDSVMELDVVTNYHVGQILTLRRELLKELRGA